MAYSSTYTPTNLSYHTIPSLTFIAGPTVSNIKVAYRIFGTPSSPHTALISTCYGGLVNETLNFTSPGSPLSTHRVIVAAMLGNGESSSSNHPSFPQTLHYRDVVNAMYALTRHGLGIEHLDVMAGFSMGGQVAYHFAVMYPDYVRNVISICSSARTSGHNYAFLEGPKSALLNSVDFQDGEWKTQGREGKRPIRGLKAFGRVYSAWLTSGAWFRQEQWKGLGFESVEGWIAGRAEKSFEGWDPDDVIILARMWQAADVGKVVDDGKGGSGGSGDAWKRALGEKVKARILVMPSRTDQYFAWEDSEEEVRVMKEAGVDAEFAVIETVWGHTAGGGADEEDTRWMGERIASWLEQGRRRG